MSIVFALGILICNPYELPLLKAELEGVISPEDVVTNVGMEYSGLGGLCPGSAETSREAGSKFRETPPAMKELVRVTTNPMRGDRSISIPYDPRRNALGHCEMQLEICSDQLE